MISPRVALVFRDVARSNIERWSRSHFESEIRRDVVKNSSLPIRYDVGSYRGGVSSE